MISLVKGTRFQLRLQKDFGSIAPNEFPPPSAMFCHLEVIFYVKASWVNIWWKKMITFLQVNEYQVCAKKKGNCQSYFVLIDPNDFEPNWQKINGNKTEGWRHHLHFFFQIRSCKAFGPWAFCEIGETNCMKFITWGCLLTVQNFKSILCSTLTSCLKKQFI